MEKRCISCKGYYNDMFEVCPHCGYVAGQEPEETFLLYPGMVLKNRYEVGMVLGHGGFGAIYKAWDTKRETCVAIKEYFQSGVVNRIPGDKEVHVFSDKKQVEFSKGLGRFLEEARSTVKFGKHDNIVNVYDYFEENGTAYIVMEYLQGRTLKEVLDENDGSLDVETSVKIYFALLHALKAVHAEGIVHRDISPDNVFLTDSGKIKLIDFGAAKFAKQKAAVNDVVVKPGFAPPEQYRTKGKLGSWTDIYSVGATMYRILTGVTPQESVKREAEDGLLPPDQIQPVIPEFLSSIVMKCMRLEQELRFHDVEQVERALRRGQIVKERIKQIRSRKSKRGVVFALILLLCAIIGAAGSDIYIRHAEKEKNQPMELSIWLKSETEKRETELAAFEKIAENFKVLYPNVQFKINCYIEEEYEKKLAEARSKEQLPDIYESTGMTEEGIPISCNFPVIYEAVGYEGEQNLEGSTLSDFLSGKSQSYAAGVECYLQIREAKLGEYRVNVQEPCEIVFDNCMSVNEGISKKEKRMASQFVTFLQEPESQEILCIDYANGIPINQAAADTYFTVFSELQQLEQQLNSYHSTVGEVQ